MTRRLFPRDSARGLASLGFLAGLWVITHAVSCSNKKSDAGTPTPAGGSSASPGSGLGGTSGSTGLTQTGGMAALGGAGTAIASGGTATIAGAGGITLGGPSAGTGGTTSGSGGAAGSVSSLLRAPGTDHYDCSPATGTLPPLKLTAFVTMQNNPIYITHAPNETDRLFVIEQTGRIRVIKNGVVNATPFLDLVSKVDTTLNWEQGLLGLAFHPDYATNGLFYVHYNSAKSVSGYKQGSAMIVEYKVSSSNPDVADPASERVVISAETTNGYHNGGSIWFGPGKYLFFGLGDGAGDTRNPDMFPGAPPNDHLNRKFAQDTTSLRGKLNRINPLKSGDSPYTNPAGNLIDVIPTARPEIWDYGLRNPYRTNMDACTGDIYIGDVGDRAWEEHDIEPGGTGHYNYGWAIREGNACHKDYTPRDSCVDPERYRKPFHTHPNRDGDPGKSPEFQAAVGGSVYRGSAIPALRGTYFFTDLYGPIWTLRYDAATDTISPVTNVESQLNPAQKDRGIVAIQNGGDGELYFVSRGSSSQSNNSTSGVIYKLEAGP
ncbi:MAG: PQQ-dependent sugar dehydrogenase [Pseudomonadota bacterium]